MSDDELRAKRADAGRKGMASRWAQHRADRIAAGLPPTREEELGRRSTYLDDPDVESYWIERVRALGIDRREAESRGIAEVTVRQLRRLAMALCESETTRMAETPTISNSGLDRARPSAKASSISSPISLSMMIFSRGCASAAPLATKKAAASIPIILRILSPLTYYLPS